MRESPEHPDVELAFGDLLRELLDAGRPAEELEVVSGAARGDAARWLAGVTEPTAEQRQRLARWRAALAAGLEAATGRDLRGTLPVAPWLEPGADAAAQSAMPPRPSPWPDDARAWAARRRRAAWGACAELLALAAGSDRGWQAVNAELLDLEDELRLRAAGWRLSESFVEERAATIYRELAARAHPAEAWAHLHRDVRWLELVVRWPAGVEPPEREVGVEARVADALGVAADTVTIRWVRAFESLDFDRDAESWLDLAVLAGREAPVSGRTPASGEPGPRTPEPPASDPARTALRATLQRALDERAHDLAWALRVARVAPVDAWATVTDTIVEPQVEVVAQWADTDGVPAGSEQPLRAAVAAHLGVDVARVAVYGAPDLPLGDLVRLAATAVRLVPEG